MQCRPNMRTNCWNTLFTPMAQLRQSIFFSVAQQNFWATGDLRYMDAARAPLTSPHRELLPPDPTNKSCGLPFWSKKLGTAITRGYIAMVCIQGLIYYDVHRFRWDVHLHHVVHQPGWKEQNRLGNLCYQKFHLQLLQLQNAHTHTNVGMNQHFSKKRITFIATSYLV